MKKMPSRSDEPIFPESTVESANRRNFIKKAATVTAVAGLGATILGNRANVLPKSFAKTDGCGVSYNCDTGIAVYGQTDSGRGIEGYALTTGFGVYGISSCSSGVIGRQTYACATPTTCGPFGVCGASASRFGAGIRGYSTAAGGIGILASEGNPCSVPFVARGYCGQKANLMEFENNVPAALSIINPNGWFGIGTTSAPTTLTVGGSLSAKTVIATRNYKMGNDDFAVLANGTLTVTLPPASTATGMIVFVKNASTSTVTIEAYKKGSETDTIEGASSKSLKKQYDSMQLISNGTKEWFVLGNSICGSFTS
jgi:hypothetical protein